MNKKASFNLAIFAEALHLSFWLALFLKKNPAEVIMLIMKQEL